MPVHVDCRVNTSRLRWLYLSIVVSCAVTLLLVLPISPWFALLALLLYWLVYHIWQSELSCDYLSFRGVEVILSDAGEQACFLWRGGAIRSHAFIRLTLFDDESRCAYLTIWQDSVSNANWRALNMAIRVHESAAKSSLNNS